MNVPYQVGETVDITLRGARVVNFGASKHGPFLLVALQTSGEELKGRIHYELETVTVERAQPESWPPRYGDLWSDASGELWVVRRCYSGRDRDGETFREELNALSDTLADLGCRGADWLQQQRGPLALVSRIERVDAAEFAAAVDGAR